MLKWKFQKTSGDQQGDNHFAILYLAHVMEQPIF